MRARRPWLPLAVLPTALAGCSDGRVDGELFFHLNGENVSYFEDVLYPDGAATSWREILSPRNAYVDFKVPYDTERVSALITQEGDLQITAHLEMGERYRDLLREGELDETYAYLLDEEYNGALGTDESGEPYAVGSLLYQEVVDGIDADYFAVDQDIRLVLVINLPEDEEALRERWTGEGAEYPKELVANYLHTDEDGQRLPLEEIQLAAFLVVGQQQFEADYDPASDHVDLVLERFVHPEDQDEADDPTTRGSLDVAFTSPNLEAIGGRATIRAEFEVIVREDPWALDQPEPAEDIDVVR